MFKRIKNRHNLPRFLKISKNDAGIIEIRGPNFVKFIDEKNMSKNEKFEAIRWEVLNLGMVFGAKAQKQAKRCLNICQEKH